MKKVKFNCKSNIIAQLPAGVEADVVIGDDGTVYIPAFSMPGITDSASNGTSAPAKKTETPSEESAPSSGSDVENLDEDQMMEMEIQELLDHAKELGIDVNETKGRNTNKKVRLLILEAQKSAAPAKKASKSDEDDDDDEKGAEAISAVLDKYETEEITEKEAVKKLVGLDIDKDTAKKAIDDFQENPEIEIDDLAKQLAEGTYGSDETEEPAAEKTSRRGKGKKASKKKSGVIDPDNFDDLEVGDELAVKCSDGEFDCEVKSNKDGKVVLHFPETEEEEASDDKLDAEYYTEVSYR